MFDNSQFFSGGGFYPKTIDQSLRFNDDDSAYLSRTPASAGSARTATLSMWVKRGNITVGNEQWLWQVGTGNRSQLIFDSSDKLKLNVTQSGSSKAIGTTAVFRDTSSWYHIVAVIDVDNATSTDRLQLYINGVRVTDFDSATYPNSGTDLDNLNNTVIHNIGRLNTGARYFDGYLAEVHFTDGTAYTADAFGEFKSGVWVAKAPSVDYGTNGFYLDFANSADIGNDVSGEGNDWTPNNFTASDVVLDSPTDNFCTLNPLDTTSLTLSEGNLKYAYTTTGWRMVTSTFGVNSGKYYAEVVAGNTDNIIVGIVNKDATRGNTTSYAGYDSDGYGYYGANGSKYNGSGAVAYGATYTSGDVIGIALDLDSGTLTFYKNGVSQGTAFSSIPNDDYFIAVATSGAYYAITNFGQDSSFAGNKTSGSANAQDANGIGDFYYTPPTGYLALSTANLPDPVIDPAQDESPEDYFNTVLYTGNGSTQSITGVGFQPDWLWLKGRSVAYNHSVVDAVRGANLYLTTNNTNGETNNSAYVASLDSDGFTLGSNGTVNQSSATYVAWNWKANGSGVSNTDGTITSTVSANTTSGFSIVSYNSGAAGTGKSVGHGLSQTPDLIINKNRDAAGAWTVWCSKFSNPAQGYMQLNQTYALVNDSRIWDNTAPDSTKFYFESGYTHLANDNIISFCWHEVEGYSKFGSYTGNGSADGTFVYTGFRPSFVMIKRTNITGNWFMFDTARSTYNEVDDNLYANLSNAEQSDTDIDFLSNGFKLRNSGANSSGNTYIYMAFAEDGGAFKYSRAR